MYVALVPFVYGVPLFGVKFSHGVYLYKFTIALAVVNVGLNFFSNFRVEMTAFYNPYMS